MGDLVADAAGGDRDVDRRLDQLRRLAGDLARPPMALAGSAAVEVLDRGLAAVARSPVPELVVDRLLEARVVERVVERVLADPQSERLVATTLERPEIDRIVDRLLDSPEMQRVVERIARSPEVRDAITAQSMGLADEVADQVRTRAIAGDDAAERLARRLLRRRDRS